MDARRAAELGVELFSREAHGAPDLFVNAAPVSDAPLAELVGACWEHDAARRPAHTRHDAACYRTHTRHDTTPDDGADVTVGGAARISQTPSTRHCLDGRGPCRHRGRNERGRVPV